MREYLFFTSLLSPVDVATMVALVAVMLIFNGAKRATLREAFDVMLAVVIPLAMWMAFTKGMQWPPVVRYAGVFAIAGVALYTREGFSLVGATVGAGILLVANVGCTALMK
jgi:hypothetical protein